MKGYEEENTIPSFKKAVELGLSKVEFNIHLTKDGKLVVMHDFDLKRMTGKSRKIKDLTFNELRRIKTKRGNIIPTLEEVLEILKGKTKINIELKGPGTAKKTLKILGKYFQNGEIDVKDVFISSFNHKELEEFSKNNKYNLTIQALYSSDMYKNKPIDDNIINYVKNVLNASSMNLSLEYVTKELVDKLHKNGLKVYVYTVNGLEDKKRMKEYGVDGIFTDFP